MPNYSNLDVETRAEQAVTYFKSGYNCAQSVYMAYADRFRQENGNIICRELLGIAPIKESPVPSPRTDAYYKKRPCVELVRMSATFIGEELKKL